jgi:hypothetical protein
MFLVAFNQPMANAIQMSGHSGGSFSNAIAVAYCLNGLVAIPGASSTNKNIMSSLVNTGQYQTVEYTDAAISMQSGHNIRFIGTDLSSANAAKLYRDTSNNMRCVLPNAGSWRFRNAADNADNLMIDSSGRIGVGIDPQFIGGKVSIYGDTQFEPSVVIRNSSNDANAGYIYFDKQKNGLGTGTLSAGDDIGTIRWRASHLASYIEAAEIQAEADGSSGAASMPTRLVFKTTPSGGTATVERARIDSAGNLVVTGAGGLGYGTGSGGTQTQTGSRTTGVTLNKTNGSITLVSAAGTATWQSFTVTNSTVAATDTVIVSQRSGADLYQIFVTNVAAGSFRISFATTGGTTTEQPVFNFAVIKAVTA